MMEPYTDFLPIGFRCKFNDGVECRPEEDACARCGWNPAVAEARTAEILKRLKEENEEERSKSDEEP